MKPAFFTLFLTTQHSFTGLGVCIRTPNSWLLASIHLSINRSHHPTLPTLPTHPFLPQKKTPPITSPASHKPQTTTHTPSKIHTPHHPHHHHHPNPLHQPHPAPPSTASNSPATHISHPSHTPQPTPHPTSHLAPPPTTRTPTMYLRTSVPPYLRTIIYIERRGTYLRPFPPPSRVCSALFPCLCVS